MKIPESTWYRDGQPHVEDIPGYALCTQCRHCPLTHLGQIEDYGFWYCFKRKRWHRGDDILVYHCRDFEIKSCNYCKRAACSDKSDAIAWCNNYRDNKYHTHARYYVGRPSNTIGMIRDPVAKQKEKDFLAWRRHQLEEAADAGKELHTPQWWEAYASNNQTDGGIEKGEPEKDQS